MPNPWHEETVPKHRLRTLELLKSNEAPALYFLTMYEGSMAKHKPLVPARYLQLVNVVKNLSEEV